MPKEKEDTNKEDKKQDKAKTESKEESKEVKPLENLKPTVTTDEFKDYLSNKRKNINHIWR